MQKEIVAAGHYEEEFAVRFAEYINSHKLLSLDVVAFTDKGKLKKYESINPVRIRIIPKEWQGTGKQQEGIRTLYWSEEEEPDPLQRDEPEREMFLCRYQPADRLAEQIRIIAGLSEVKRIGITGKTKLIGIYSPVGRCLKTSFSLTLGQLLAVRYKVLYLNFENFSGFGQILGLSRPTDMSDLLYYFLNLSEEFDRKMEEATVKLGSMDIIPPALSFLDLEEISESDWETFFQTLASKTGYDYILLDLSDYVKGLYETLMNCSYIYTMAPADGLATAKVEQYERMIKSLHYGEILERTRKMTPPVFRKLPIRPEELIHSELAEYIKTVTEDDFHWSTSNLSKTE